MKDFLLIANTNACTYKEFFPLLKDRKVSMGVEMPKEYDMPDGTTKKFGNICWYTTLHTPDKRKLILTKRYHHELYPHYDNYNAIEVSRIKDIPYDYDCVMGVPITILQYDLDNVEVEGLLGNFKEADCNETTGFVCGDDVSAYNLPGTQNGPVIITSSGPEAKYKRILIKKNFEIVSNSDFAQEDIPGWSGVSQEFYDRYYEQGNTGQIEVGWPLPHYTKDGKAIIPYKRVLIKKKIEIRGIWNDKREEADFIVKGTPTYIDEKHKNFQGPVVDGKAKYARVLIRNKRSWEK